MTRRIRIPLVIYPTWNATIEKWTRWQIKKNMWRFDEGLNEIDDVLQEARMVFCRLERKYPAVTDMPHFFTLYKTSLFRMFVNKGRKKRRSAVDPNASIDDVREEACFQNYGYLSLILQELPDELKSVLQALTSRRTRLKLNESTRKVCPLEHHTLRRLMKKPLASGRVRLRTADPVGDLRSYLANS